MASAVSSIYEYPISAASAAYAPTNTAEVTAMIDSAVSGKLDASASSAFITSTAGCQPAGDYVSSSELADYQTTAGMSAYATTAALGDKLDASASSAFITSTADCMPLSASSNYATTGDLSGKLDASAEVVTSINTTSIGAETFVNGINGNYLRGVFANMAVVDTNGRDLTSLADSSSLAEYQPTSSMSAYASTADLSAKLDTSAIETSTAGVTGIGGTAIAGGGGSSPVEMSGTVWNSAESATAQISSNLSGISVGYHTNFDGTNTNIYALHTDGNGNNYHAAAKYLYTGAECSDGYYFLKFAPNASMWTTADVATGIFSPLQYGTGAGMFLDNSNFKGYLKGNEWFVANTAYGYARGEVHQSRGSRVIVEHTGGAWAVLSAKKQYAYVTLNSTAYGTAEMAVANSQSYVQVQRRNSASKYNSAKLDTDYLKFYNGMTTGYLDPEDTASGTAYLPGETEYIYISSIPYWNGKLDSSSIETSTAGITGIGGTAIAGGGGGGGGTTYSAGQYIQISGNEISVTGIDPTSYVEKSAYDNLYSSFTSLSSYLDQYTAYFGDLSSISGKVDSTAIGLDTPPENPGDIEIEEE